MGHCPKCNGFGYLPQYKNIDNGVCYECGGIKTRKETLKEYWNKKHEEDRAQKELENKIWKLEGSIVNFTKYLEEAQKENDIKAVEYFTNLLNKFKVDLKQLETQSREVF